jgi:hypothetical protein
MTQAVSSWSVTLEARVLHQVNLCGICGAESGTGRGSSKYTSMSLLTLRKAKHVMFQ